MSPPALRRARAGALTPARMPSPRTSDRFDRIVRHQFGQITHGQLVDQGWSQHHIRHALKTGQLIRVQPDVYRCVGSPITYPSRLLAACLAAGPDAAASHRAAAHVWTLPVLDPPVELTVPHTRHPTPTDVCLHRSTDLRPEHVTIRHGIPVTNPLRVLVDLGAVVSTPVLADVVDAAVVKGLVTFPAIVAMLDEVARRGRRGVGPLRAVLEDRPLGDVRPESVLEPVMARIIRHHGIDGVQYQHEVAVGTRTFRLDFGVPHVTLGIEVDGIEWHGTRKATIRDRERRRLLKSAGWDLFEYTARDMRRHPARCAREILTEIRRREQVLAALGLDSPT